MPRVSQVRLSATLIVRNEAAHLRRCLASIRTFTDEIIVVDTGSTDNSPAVAAEFGARLFALDWQGDFSAARNHALAHASGDWILYIDADECARPLNADALRVALADPGLVAATVAFRSRTGMTRYRECRLFRNDPRIRFRNVIHETMMNDVHAVAQSDGLGIGRSQLALDHFGDDGDQSAKHRRNIPLLRARLARDPGHVYSWNHLGQALMGVGDVRAAVEAWQRAIDTVRGRGVQGALDALPYGSLLLFGGEQVAPGLLDEARARFPADLLLQWLQGQQLADAGRFNEAIALLEPLAAIDPDVFCLDDGIAYDDRIFGEPTWHTLALCHFRLGHYSDSARYYARAAAADPSNASYVAKQRLAEARAGKVAERS